MFNKAKTDGYYFSFYSTTPTIRVVSTLLKLFTTYNLVVYRIKDIYLVTGDII